MDKRDITNADRMNRIRISKRHDNSPMIRVMNEVRCCNNDKVDAGPHTAEDYHLSTNWGVVRRILDARLMYREWDELKDNGRPVTLIVNIREMEGHYYQCDYVSPSLESDFVCDRNGYLPEVDNYEE